MRVKNRISTKIDTRTATVDHDRWMPVRSGLETCCYSWLDEFFGIVWTCVSPAKDDMHIVVTTGLNDSGKTLVSYPHERMGTGRRLHGIHCNGNGTVRSIFKTW